MRPIQFYIISSFILLTIVAFTSCAPERGGPDPSNYEDFVEEQDKYPVFSPDGVHIAYYHYSSRLPEPVDYPSGLYIIDKKWRQQDIGFGGTTRKSFVVARRTMACFLFERRNTKM
jgi:hypothetical protein